MAISVNKPGASGGSFLTNMMGMFNTGKQIYNAVKGEEATESLPQWSTGSFDPAVNSLGGQTMAGQIGAQANNVANAYGAYGASTAAGTSGAGEGAEAAEGGESADAALALAGGGFVPGRASVPGDSYANDKVTVRESPGELVVPRSAIDKGPQAAEDFVMDAMKRRLAHGGFVCR